MKKTYCAGKEQKNVHEELYVEKYINNRTSPPFFCTTPDPKAPLLPARPHDAPGALKEVKEANDDAFPVELPNERPLETVLALTLPFKAAAVVVGVAEVEIGVFPPRDVPNGGVGMEFGVLPGGVERDAVIEEEPKPMKESGVMLAAPVAAGPFAKD